MLDQGPTGVFDSTMTTAIDRFCQLELITASVTFDVLEYRFPSGETFEITSATTYTKDTQILEYVKKFKITSGAVLAHFYTLNTTPGFSYGFDPASLSGLILWLKADALLLSNNDAISTWTDFSGTNNHATQAVANKRPLYLTNSINGLPAVKFDGINDGLTFPNSFPPHQTTFIVAVLDAAPASQLPYAPFIITDGDFVDRGTRICARVAGTNWGSFKVGSGDLPTGENLVAGETNIFDVISGVGGAGSGGIYFNRNGVLIASSGGDIAGSSANNFIGEENGGNFLNARIGEIIAYDHVPTVNETDAVRAYLSRWTI